MALRLCALSVDLDEIPNYRAIHGIEGPSKQLGDTAVYDVAIARLVEAASALEVPLTFFVVGRDLERPQAAEQLRRAVERGHCIGNHTYSHRYDLTRLESQVRADEIGRCHAVVEALLGVSMTGFRAPGYTITDPVFAALADQGYRWDSSVFPCPFYKAVKDTAILGYRALGRRSRSVIDTPNVLRAPTDPYRIGQPYWRRGEGLLELPIAVTHGLRLPYIGTTLMMAGPSGAAALTSQMLGRPFINLELHGIDVLDDADAGLAGLAATQRDLRIPRARKEDTLFAVVRQLRASGYSFVRMDEAAEAFAR